MSRDVEKQRADWRAATNRYRSRHRDRVRARKAELMKQYRMKHQERIYRQLLEDTPKRRARKALYFAIRSGKVKKPSNCEDCGLWTPSRRLHGHHNDYTKPLSVVWLCAGCHKKRHPTPDGNFRRSQ